MNIIFQIDGGIGKSIMATAVCEAIKKQYPSSKLIVITGYPEVFLCNPFVDVKLGFGERSYFYEKYVEGKDQENKYFLLNPYLTTDFVNRKGHLIKVWCEMFGIHYNDEQPKIYLNQREKDFYSKSFISQKPIMVIQTNGGAANQPNKYSWARDLPIGLAQQIVNHFAQYFKICHIRRDDQPALPNTTPIQADFRAIVVLISMSTKRLLIDSFAQHIAAALDMPSVVCWIANEPGQFGYAIHTNIIANPSTVKPELKFSQFTKYNIGGNPLEFPYNNENEIFNIQEIADAIINTPREVMAAPIQANQPASDSQKLVDSVSAEIETKKVRVKKTVETENVEV